MLVAFIIFFVVFVILAVLTFMGKTASFVTGDKKDTEGNPIYDEKSLSKFLGVIMSLLAVSALFGVLGYIIKSATWLIIVAPVMFIAVILFALVFVNTGNRFVLKSRGRRYRK